MNLTEKVAIITGASSGIGEATAIALAKKGAHVVLASRRVEKLEQIKKTIISEGGNALVVSTDITKKEEVDQLINKAMEAFGHVDILVNNAGIMLLSFFEKGKVEEWDKMIDVNIKGVLYGINAVLPIMLKQDSGHIINISSVAGYENFPSSAVYSGTKHAVRAITEGLRIELRNQPKIKVTAISPGAVATELTTHITDEDVSKMFGQSKNIPLTSDDIANAIVYAVTQPEQVDINDIIIRPSTQRP